MRAGIGGCIGEGFFSDCNHFKWVIIIKERENP